MPSCAGSGGVSRPDQEASIEGGNGVQRRLSDRQRGLKKAVNGGDGVPGMSHQIPPSFMPDE